MKKLILTLAILTAANITNSQISLKELDEDMSHPFSYEMAIVDENGNTLFVEKQDDDKQIIGHGQDFYVVYRNSTKKVYVKSPKGAVLSGMVVPEGCYVEAVNYDNMTDHEQFDAKTTKTAFTIVNPDTDQRNVYNKHCKRIGGY